MHAITLHQPWATLIALGFKDKETRTWAPPKRLIGHRIAIHAAQRSPFKLVPADDNGTYSFINVKAMPRGVVVATARLAWAGIVKSHYNKDEQAMVSCMTIPVVRRQKVFEHIPIDPYGDYSVGRWVWFLDDVQPLKEPIPAKGKQKFWLWDGE